VGCTAIQYDVRVVLRDMLTTCCEKWVMMVAIAGMLESLTTVADDGAKMSWKLMVSGAETKSGE